MNATVHAFEAVSTTDTWADTKLIPLERGTLPRLHAHLLGGHLGDFAAALAIATETPEELTASLVLGAASTAAARRIRVRVKPDYFEPCNLWILPALAPGNRKSAVEKAAAAPLREWEREQAEVMAPQIASAKSEAKVIFARAKELQARAAKAESDAEALDLAKQAAAMEANAPAVPTVPQLWTSDATPENLGVLLADHGERMAWLSAEGGFFEIIGGRYSKGVPNLDLMLKAHAGDSERVDRISRPPVYLREPLLTLAMSPQPELLGGLATRPGFRGRGLLGRFLYFLPPSPLGYRTLDGASMPEEVRARYRDVLRAMLQWPERRNDHGEPSAFVLRLSAGAETELREFALTMEAQMRPGAEFEYATDWAGKAPGAAARVAGVLHAATHASGEPWVHEIPAATMNRALEIVSVSSRHALAVFDLMGADDCTAAAARLWSWIKRKQFRTFKARDAWQGLKGANLFTRMADIDEALNVLAERGYVRFSNETIAKPGRTPSRTVLVRPSLTEDWA